MESQPIQVEAYENSQGNRPFTDWFDNLDDEQGKLRILATIRKVQSGNTGPLKRLKGYKDLSEIRVIGEGPGYRLYCTQRGQTLIILLGGGVKDTQTRDIKKAAKEADDLRKNG